MKTLKPRLSEARIKQIVDVEDGLVILETKAPEKKSNMYKVGYDFSLLWEGEYREYGTGPVSLYEIFEENGLLLCPGSPGNTYVIDPKTGNILKEIYTK